MNYNEFANYILENFSLSREAWALVHNILDYIERVQVDPDAKKDILIALLDGAIGLTEEELDYLNFLKEV